MTILPKRLSVDDFANGQRIHSNIFSKGSLHVNLYYNTRIDKFETICLKKLLKSHFHNTINMSFTLLFGHLVFYVVFNIKYPLKLRNHNGVDLLQKT